jgi:hypothetical protein
MSITKSPSQNAPEKFSVSESIRVLVASSYGAEV